MINVIKMVWITKGDKFSGIVSIMLLVILTLFSGIIWYILMKNFNTLASNITLIKYGSLYSELRFNRKLCLLYHVVFVTRRLIFTIIAIFL